MNNKRKGHRAVIYGPKHNKEHKTERITGNKYKTITYSITEPKAQENKLTSSSSFFLQLSVRQ